jgi:P pilus assembly chaperone PapD
MFIEFDLHAYGKLIARWMLALAMAATPAAAQLGLGLVPMRLEFRLAAGQQTSGTLNLSNDSQTKVRIRTELLDFFVDRSATPQFERSLSSEAGDSCRAWLTVNPMETEAAAGAQLPVRYTIRVPEGVAEGSYHCAAGFLTLPPADQANAGGIRTAVRVVTAFYVVVGNPPMQGQVKDIQVEPMPARAPNGPAWQAVVVIENRGRMHLRPSGTLTVLDSSGQTVETAQFQSLPVLPSREQRFLFPLKTDVNSGGYKLRARVDLGTGEIQEANAVVAPGGK